MRIAQVALRSVAVVSLLAAAACGAQGRPNNGDDDGSGSGSGTVDAPMNMTGPEICNDAIDNDGDGRADCSDPDCSGVGDCPICGSVENPSAQPLALPDGIGQSTVCSTDAQCTDPQLPNCVAKECHASYTSTLNFIGFPQGATLTDPSKLLSVCVNMEHSWLRDLQMELITPSGGVFILHKFIDRTGGELYLGQANDSDTPAAPVPGTGATYCWTMAAPTEMLNTAGQPGPTQTYNSSMEIVPGNYKSIAPWASLANTMLNGTWTMRVTDLWPIDNGFMFSWSIKFDPSLVSDCSGPIIL